MTTDLIMRVNMRTTITTTKTTTIYIYKINSEKSGAPPLLPLTQNLNIEKKKVLRDL